jgi:protein gp37
VVRFVSAEPLIGPLDLTRVGPYPGRLDTYARLDVLDSPDPRVGWVIVGGESGPRARPCDLAWIRSIVQQCRAAGVPVFVKQLGSSPVAAGGTVGLRGRKGAEPSEWPEDLRVQETPSTHP